MKYKYFDIFQVKELAGKTDFIGELKPDPIEQLFKNFNEMDEQTNKKVQRIFDKFGFNLYNAFSPLSSKEYLKKSTLV